MDTDRYQQAQDWKRQFASTENISRHALFGSALTEGEREEWKKTTISDWSNEDSVRMMMKRRQELAHKMLERYSIMAGMSKQDAIAYANKEGLNTKLVEKNWNQINDAGATPAATSGGGSAAAPDSGGWTDAGGGLRYRVKP
jgi:hypothetical protein